MLEDVRIAQDHDNFVITFLDINGDLSNDRIRLIDARTKVSSRVEELEFEDGSVHKITDILATQRVIYGTDDDNKLSGGRDNDRLEAGAGSDTIAAGAGDDYLDGGSGTDYLYGGKGSDSYVFGFGSGDTYLYETAEVGAIDTLLLGTGVNRDNISLTYSGYHLQLNLLTEQGRVSDQATLSDALKDSQDHIEQLKFMDGSTLSLKDMSVDIAGNGSGNTLYGATGMKNLFHGGGHNDALHGRDQDDTYLFDRGDGQDWNL